MPGGGLRGEQGGDLVELIDEVSLVDFGYSELYPADANRVTRTFRVVNEGAGPLTLDEPIVMPLGFTLEQSFGLPTLMPGESTTFVVSVDAAAPGLNSRSSRTGARVAAEPRPIGGLHSNPKRASVLPPGRRRPK